MIPVLQMPTAHPITIGMTKQAIGRSERNRGAREETLATWAIQQASMGTPAMARVVLGSRERRSVQLNLNCTILVF